MGSDWSMSMSGTVTRPRLKTPSPAEAAPSAVPPLNSGDRLSRAEFERRYDAHPEIKVAELIEGSVYVGSPVRCTEHAEPHSHLATWATLYCASNRAVRVADNATVRLDNDNVVQPDVLLRMASELGGRCRESEDGYLEGPPELVAEVAASSASYDLHQKLRVYQRSGVQEYIVAQAYERRVDWFALRDGVYEALQPDERGIVKSERFPGLWLKPEAFWEGHLPAMLAILQEGLTSLEHGASVAGASDPTPASQ